jgi:hypothetical protein
MSTPAGVVPKLENGVSSSSSMSCTYAGIVPVKGRDVKDTPAGIVPNWRMECRPPSYNIPTHYIFFFYCSFKMKSHKYVSGRKLSMFVHSNQNRWANYLNMFQYKYLPNHLY